MTDKKLTDNEIIKALECCIKWKREGDCAKCPLWESETLCVKEMRTLALDLINRLQADVENYKQIAEHQQSVTMDRGFEIKRLKEEYPFKCKVGNNSEIHSKSIEDYDRLIADIQAEAYKEFAERLKKEIIAKYNWYDEQEYPRATINDIDNILKELVCEKDVR